MINTDMKNQSPLHNNLQDLATILTELVRKPEIDHVELVKSIPLRALSGNHINGGKILGFSSSGITDKASTTQITIIDDLVSINRLEVGEIPGDLKVNNVTVQGNIKAKSIEVDEIKSDLRLERSSSLEFKGDKSSAIFGKGLIWSGSGYTKQLILLDNPDRIFSTESIDLASNRAYYINNVKIIDERELSPTISKSNLKEVGRLRSLHVSGSVNVGDQLFYDPEINRLSLGTDQPNGTLSVYEDGVEVIMGTKEHTKGCIGTFASHDLDIVTDDTPRMTFFANGNMQMGYQNSASVVSVYGKLSLNVKNSDPNVDLHVRGPIKFNDVLHTHGEAPPEEGVYKKGDLMWNSSPQEGGCVGWVCIRSGTPGLWRSFGMIDRYAS